MGGLEERTGLAWWWRRTDQAAIAVIVTSCSLVLGATLVWQITLHHRWIDIDHEVVEPIAFRVDVNEAPWPELALLPGIGETAARELVQFRQRHGRFRTETDLLRVPGIGPRTVERLRPYLEPFPSPEDAGSGADP